MGIRDIMNTGGAVDVRTPEALYWGRCGEEDPLSSGPCPEQSTGIGGGEHVLGLAGREGLQTHASECRCQGRADLLRRNRMEAVVAGEQGKDRLGGEAGMGHGGRGGPRSASWTSFPRAGVTGEF